MMKNVLNQLMDLYRYLEKSIKYGYIKNGKPEFEDFSEFLNYWTYRHPKIIIDDGIGVCWDYTLLESCFEIKGNVQKLSVFFWDEGASDDEDAPTHTITCFLDFDKNKCYVVESSWYDKRGVHVFNSYKDAILTYLYWLNTDKNTRSNASYNFTRYDPLDENLFGLKALDLELYIYRNRTKHKTLIKPQNKPQNLLESTYKK